MPLVEQALVAVEEDGRSDLDKVISHVCWRAHRHGCFIATKSPPIASVLFVVAGGH